MVEEAAHQEASTGISLTEASPTVPSVIRSLTSVGNSHGTKCDGLRYGMAKASPSLKQMKP